MTTDKLTPDEDLLPLCEELMRSEITTIKDLPREFANTLANEYYRFLVLAAPHIKHQLVGRITLSMIKEYLLNETLEFGVVDAVTKSNPESELARALAGVEAIAQCIEVLRGIDKNKDPIQYRSTIELIIDHLKYDIRDAGGKLLIKRLFERAVKKSKKQVKEQIPDLIDYIDI
ncbi:hypothetical protein [Candidatus Magnetominusculus dajiuhuensis]|uniref:hypothetical protein n=1 Tax=Candidatus Magnetominusculus dajiuhuensis TaxID=3137712 RepID=UPI003B428723